MSDTEGVVFGVFIGGIITVLVFVFMIGPAATEKANAVISLGDAICDQEHDMTFDYFEDGILYCKPKETPQQLDSYDGVIIGFNRGE